MEKVCPNGKKVCDCSPEELKQAKIKKEKHRRSIR